MHLGFGIAVAVAMAEAGSCSSDSTLAWELAYSAGVALKSKKNKQTNNNKKRLDSGISR